KEKIKERGREMHSCVCRAPFHPPVVKICAMCYDRYIFLTKAQQFGSSDREKGCGLAAGRAANPRFFIRQQFSQAGVNGQNRACTNF
ncbi:MAG: hypothetical protein Q4C65_13775, partial [Eubacteriales bacterium]|nr:hypothetical protein [Eubacteriales bacterium]